MNQLSPVRKSRFSTVASAHREKACSPGVAALHKKIRPRKVASWQVGPCGLGFVGVRLYGQAAAAVAQPAAVEQSSDEGEDSDAVEEDGSLTPNQIVQQLDRYIVGQPEAKRAVAIALRNRWRRHRIGDALKDEVMPKNILMIGPTGVGKTEVARRLAKLADAPFVKVEATKFTEVGFHGRDVDQIIRDLLENAIALIRQKARRTAAPQLKEEVDSKILEAVCGAHADPRTLQEFRQLLNEGKLDTQNVTIDVPAGGSKSTFDASYGGQETAIKLDRMPSSKKSEKKTMTIKEARPILEEVALEKLAPPDRVVRDAIKSAEDDGIVFIDEIDKIVSSHETRFGADASSEGVQRDLLPIIEGSAVHTRHGNVNTDHILFVCSGAFHSCKPSDMLAELQGRLPIRVELHKLTREDFYKILTVPETNLLKQQQALLRTEGIQLSFTEDAIREIAQVAEEVNLDVENIGARRLHTVMERITEQVSFDAPELVAAARKQHGSSHVIQHVVNKEEVQEKMADLLKKQDLAKYIL